MMRKIFFLVAAVCSFSAYAQQVYHVSAAKGSDQAKGSLKHPFKTINAAAQIAQPGDVITVHAGVYRELIVPKRGGSSEKQRITYQAAKGEKVVVKGSEIVKGWSTTDQKVWKLTLPDTYFGNYNPFKDLVFGDWYFPGRNKVHTGEVYLDELPLGEVGKAENNMSWSTEAKGDSTIIYANFAGADPNQRTVEINVRPACFYPAVTGINYLTIKGFRMSQAATQWAAPTAEQIGLIGTNWSKGWIIEGNIISDSKCVGIALGKDRASGHNVWFKNRAIDGAVHYNNMVKKVIEEGWSKATIGSHIVRNNTIFRCGQAGVCGSFGAAFSQITGNDIYDIYTYRNFWGAEMAGIKLHAGIDALIKNNRIHNAQKGIWLDWMAQGTRVTSNLLYDNDYVDLFMEVDHGPYLVDNNLFLSKFNVRDLSQGGAFVHNLFTGLISRAPDDRSTPYFEPNSTKLVAVKAIQGGDDRFVANIFVGRRGKSYFDPVYPFQLPDSIDSLAGYGLAIYDDAKLPVTASSNVYLNGAYPLKNEVEMVIDFNHSFTFKLDTMGGKVALTLRSGFVLPPENVKVISTEALGKTFSAAQGYTLPDGTSFKIDRDYFGKTRNESGTFAGPLTWTNEREVIIWPFSFR